MATPDSRTYIRSGWPGETRTHSPPVKSRILFQLSYEPVWPTQFIAFWKTLNVLVIINKNPGGHYHLTRNSAGCLTSVDCLTVVCRVFFDFNFSLITFLIIKTTFLIFITTSFSCAGRDDTLPAGNKKARTFQTGLFCLPAWYQVHT